MDDLVEAIVAKLHLRQKQILTISCNNFANEEHSTSDFIHHQHIKLKGIGAIQLAKLAKLDASDRSV